MSSVEKKEEEEAGLLALPEIGASGNVLFSRVARTLEEGTPDERTLTELGRCIVVEIETLATVARQRWEGQAAIAMVVESLFGQLKAAAEGRRTAGTERLCDALRGDLKYFCKSGSATVSTALSAVATLQEKKRLQKDGVLNTASKREAHTFLNAALLYAVEALCAPDLPERAKVVSRLYNDLARSIFKDFVNQMEFEIGDDGREHIGRAFVAILTDSLRPFVGDDLTRSAVKAIAATVVPLALGNSTGFRGRGYLLGQARTDFETAVPRDPPKSLESVVYFVRGKGLFADDGSPLKRRHVWGAVKRGNARLLILVFDCPSFNTPYASSSTGPAYWQLAHLVLGKAASVTIAVTKQFFITHAKSVTKAMDAVVASIGLDAAGRDAVNESCQDNNIKESRLAHLSWPTFDERHVPANGAGGVAPGEALRQWAAAINKFRSDAVWKRRTLTEPELLAKLSVQVVVVPGMKEHAFGEMLRCQNVPVTEKEHLDRRAPFPGSGFREINPPEDPQNAHRAFYNSSGANWSDHLPGVLQSGSAALEQLDLYTVVPSIAQLRPAGPVAFVITEAVREDELSAGEHVGLTGHVTRSIMRASGAADALSLVFADVLPLHVSLDGAFRDDGDVLVPEEAPKRRFLDLQLLAAVVDLAKLGRRVVLVPLGAEARRSSDWLLQQVSASRWVKQVQALPVDTPTSHPAAVLFAQSDSSYRSFKRSMFDVYRGLRQLCVEEEERARVDQQNMGRRRRQREKLKRAVARATVPLELTDSEFWAMLKAAAPQLSEDTFRWRKAHGSATACRLLVLAMRDLLQRFEVLAGVPFDAKLGLARKKEKGAGGEKEKEGLGEKKGVEQKASGKRGEKKKEGLAGEKKGSDEKEAKEDKFSGRDRRRFQNCIMLWILHDIAIETWTPPALVQDRGAKKPRAGTAASAAPVVRGGSGNKGNVAAAAPAAANDKKRGAKKPLAGTAASAAPVVRGGSGNNVAAAAPAASNDKKRQKVAAAAAAAAPAAPGPLRPTVRKYASRDGNVGFHVARAGISAQRRAIAEKKRAGLKVVESFDTWLCKVHSCIVSAIGESAGRPSGRSRPHDCAHHFQRYVQAYYSDFVSANNGRWPKRGYIDKLWAEAQSGALTPLARSSQTEKRAKTSAATAAAPAASVARPAAPIAPTTEASWKPPAERSGWQRPRRQIKLPGATGGLGNRWFPMTTGTMADVVRRALVACSKTIPDEQCVQAATTAVTWQLSRYGGDGVDKATVEAGIRKMLNGSPCKDGFVSAALFDLGTVPVKLRATIAPGEVQAICNGRSVRLIVPDRREAEQVPTGPGQPAADASKTTKMIGGVDFGKRDFRVVLLSDELCQKVVQQSFSPEELHIVTTKFRNKGMSFATEAFVATEGRSSAPPKPNPSHGELDGETLKELEKRWLPLHKARDAKELWDAIRSRATVFQRLSSHYCRPMALRAAKDKAVRKRSVQEKFVHGLADALPAAVLAADPLLGLKANIPTPACAARRRAVQKAERKAEREAAAAAAAASRQASRRHKAPRKGAAPANERKRAAPEPTYNANAPVFRHVQYVADIFNNTRASSGFAPKATFDSLVRWLPKATDGRVNMSKGDNWRSSQIASPFFCAFHGVFVKKRGATMADAGPGWQGGIQSSFFLRYNPLTGLIEHRDPTAATNMAVRGAVAKYKPGDKQHRSLRLLSRKSCALNHQEVALWRMHFNG